MGLISLNSVQKTAKYHT